GRAPEPGALHADFVRAMNVAQNTTIRTAPDGPLVEFDNPELVDYLVNKQVFHASETVGGGHLLPPADRDAVRQNVTAALGWLAKTSPGLRALISHLFGRIAGSRVPARVGGAAACCLGLIWLSPADDWTLEYYAEMLVHEFVDNS